MSTRKPNYASVGTLTITLTSLSAGAYRKSVVADNTSDLALDAMFEMSIQVGTVASDGTIETYLYTGGASGTAYTGGLASGDGTITWGTSSQNYGYLDLISLCKASVKATSDNNKDIKLSAASVRAACGGTMPAKW